MSICMGLLIYSSTKGSPYIPSKLKEIDTILGQVKIKKNDLVIELGSGDGRFLRNCCKKYSCNGLGYDINPFLVFWSTYLSKKENIRSIRFIRNDIRSCNIENADLLYMFLLPKLIEKLRHKLETELRTNSIVISQGFPVLGWEAFQFKKIAHKPFPTYFYRIK